MTTQQDVDNFNTDPVQPYGSLGVGRLDDDDDALRDYEFGWGGQPLGLIRFPGMSYWTLCGWDDAEAGASMDIDRHQL